MSINRQTELMEEWYTLTGLRVVPSDVSGLTSFNGIFGDQYTAVRVPKYSVNFNYPVDTRTANFILTNGGTTSIDVNLFTAETGVDPAGEVLAVTKEYLRYTAGRDAEAMFTSIFTPGLADSFQRIGLFDLNDGFFIGYEGAEFGVTVRKGASDIFVSQSNFSGDTLDGNGPSKFVLSAESMNIYRITYGYLGIAPVIYQIYGGPEFGWITFHIHDVVNVQAVTHINKPYLPVMLHIANTGNATNVKFQSGSIYAGVIDGGGIADTSSREFSASAAEAGAPSGANQLIIFFHNKATYGGSDNFISDLLLKVGAGVESNKPSTISLYKLAGPPVGAVWIDVDTANSNMETSILGTVDLTGAELLDGWPLSRTDSFNIDASELNYKLLPDEYAAFTYTAAGAIDYEFINRWSELF